MLDRISNPREVIGGNRAPGPIDSARDTMTELSGFLQENPVIQNFEQCKQGDAWTERTRIAMQSMEDERKPLVDPLNAQLKEINEPYRIVRQPLEKFYEEIRRRVSVFKNKVERARIAEANRLRLEAEEKERIAREAEAREQDSIACADVGECSDVGGAIAEADASFRDFQLAARTAAIAERGVPMRNASIVGGRAMSMRNHTEFVLVDACAAIKAMGVTPEIEDAILKCARAFHKVHDEPPAGVTITTKRRM